MIWDLTTQKDVREYAKESIDDYGSWSGDYSKSEAKDILKSWQLVFKHASLIADVNITLIMKKYPATIKLLEKNRKGT